MITICKPNKGHDDVSYDGICKSMDRKSPAFSVKRTHMEVLILTIQCLIYTNRTCHAGLSQNFTITGKCEGRRHKLSRLTRCGNRRELDSQKD